MQPRLAESIDDRLAEDGWETGENRPTFVECRA